MVEKNFFFEFHVFPGHYVANFSLFRRFIGEGVIKVKLNKVFSSNSFMTESLSKKISPLISPDVSQIHFLDLRYYFKNTFCTFFMLGPAL